MGRIHDLGGMHGFGAVPDIADHEDFHETWEARVFGMVRGLVHNGAFALDEFRHAIERMDPAEYLASSYYQRWLDAVERICAEKGVLMPEDLAAIRGAGEEAG